MALVVTWNEYNTVGETKTAGISNIAFGSSDAADLIPASFPITAGENSFEKFLKAEFTGMASEGITEIANTKVYKSTGSYKTGEVVTYLGISVTYSTPSETDSGDSDIPITEPGAQNLGLSGSGTGVLTSDGESDYMRMQRETSVATPPGALNSLTITLLYDVS
jgi:hypothetical protein